MASRFTIRSLLLLWLCTGVSQATGRVDWTEAKKGTVTVLSFYHKDSCQTVYLLTQWEDWTWKYLAQPHDIYTV